MAVHAAHAVMQQDVGGAGRARPAVGADHAVGGERDFELLGFEPFVQKIGGALREDLDQPDDFLGAEAAQLRRRASDNRRNRPGRCGGKSGGVVSSSDSTTCASRSRWSSYSGNASASCARKLRDLRQRLRAILPHEEIAAVGKRRKERRILGVDAIAEALAAPDREPRVPACRLVR